MDEVKEKMKNTEYTFKKSLSKEAKDLLLKILKHEPKERITLEQIFQHPFVLKHLDEFENNKEIFKYIPPEPEWDNDIDLKPQALEKDAQRKFEEELVSDPIKQQEYIRKMLAESNINSAEVEKVFFLRDEKGVLKMRLQMKDRPQPKRGNSERKNTRSNPLNIAEKFHKINEEIVPKSPGKRDAIDFPSLQKTDSLQAQQLAKINGIKPHSNESSPSKMPNSIITGTPINNTLNPVSQVKKTDPAPPVPLLTPPSPMLEKQSATKTPSKDKVPSDITPEKPTKLTLDYYALEYKLPQPPNQQKPSSELEYTLAPASKPSSFPSGLQSPAPIRYLGPDNSASPATQFNPYARQDSPIQPVPPAKPNEREPMPSQQAPRQPEQPSAIRLISVKSKENYGGIQSHSPLVHPLPNFSEDNMNKQQGGSLNDSGSASTPQSNPNGFPPSFNLPQGSPPTFQPFGNSANTHMPNMPPPGFGMNNQQTPMWFQPYNPQPTMPPWTQGVPYPQNGPPPSFNQMTPFGPPPPYAQPFPLNQTDNRDMKSSNADHQRPLSKNLSGQMSQPTLTFPPMPSPQQQPMPAHKQQEGVFSGVGMNNAQGFPKGLPSFTPLKENTSAERDANLPLKLGLNDPTQRQLLKFIPEGYERSADGVYRPMNTSSSHTRENSVSRIAEEKKHESTGYKPLFKHPSKKDIEDLRASSRYGQVALPSEENLSINLGFDKTNQTLTPNTDKTKLSETLRQQGDKIYIGRQEMFKSRDQPQNTELKKNLYQANKPATDNRTDLNTSLEKVLAHYAANKTLAQDPTKNRIGMLHSSRLTGLLWNQLDSR